MTIEIPSQVRWALGRLRGAGHEAVLVGGCVRDSLMGTAPSDYDISTSALPEQVKTAFPGGRIIETGIKHGTVTLIKCGRPIEITTFRVDGEYADHRRPNNVIFTRSLESDVTRRDFTVNAICYDGEKIIDLVGGLVDIERKVLRCVGEPAQRFNEDALRIMRALRFSSTLDFDIDPPTARAALDLAPLLGAISAERIREELIKLLAGHRVYEILSEYRPVFDAALPGADSLSEHEWRMTARRADAVSAAARDMRCPELSLAALFAGFPDGLSKMRLDKKTAGRARTVIEWSKKLPSPNRASVRKFVSEIGPHCARLAAMLSQAEGGDTREVVLLIDTIEREGDCVSLSALDIDGHDLILAGIEPKDVGGALKLLLDAVMEDSVENRREALIERAARSLSPP